MGVQTVHKKRVDILEVVDRLQEGREIVAEKKGLDACKGYGLMSP